MRKLLKRLRRRSRPHSHSIETILDQLWISHIHELAEYRRTVWGWA